MSDPFHQDQIPPLPPKPKSNAPRYAVITAGVLVIALAGTLGLKAASDGSGNNHLTTVKVGTTEAADPYWTQLVKIGKQKYGLNIQPVNFTDYTQANPALAQGQIDLNQFQHLQFLAEYNESAHQNLTPIGSTYVVPLGLYSKKHTKLTQFAQGGKVAIPNDPTNEARALLLLQSAGLLKLKSGGNSLSTPADIDTSASKVGVTPVDAAQTAAALPSVEGSVVNNNFAADANLNPAKALFKDDPKSKNAEPYINVIVARKRDANKGAYAQFVQAYHDPSVQKLIEQQTKGTSYLLAKPAPDLQRILTQLENRIEAAK